MAKKMLIDATHDEEVRVAVVDGFRLEEFDSETSTKKQIKGNIYLAKVVRIEPSLQAAFVEFGGNRHGFLPFGEIHPDYFRIPVADRPQQETEGKPMDEVLAIEPEPDHAPLIVIDDPVSEGVETEGLASEDAKLVDLASEDVPLKEESKPKKRKSKKSKAKKDEPAAQPEDVGTLAEEDSTIASLAEIEEPIESAIDIVDEDDIPRRPRNYHYKIQEVIKRRQIMLIQVVKEERGNKGAALTTYLSLPGRYCVLMPNAGHRGGGISRKISDGTDRRRLRDILKDLEIPGGMSLIVRTAGKERSKVEIRRDFDYLIRLWEEIRETTLKSTAPALIYAEGDLIKRSIRDVYNREIDQILVEGDEAYKAAKGLMKALIPSHTKRVQPYKDSIPLFYRHRVEEQIDSMMNPMAKLPSGGSIVINPTEALVAIDVNSGRSTRERHIDETALKTNLEAADEIARQMRLRDLAGLIVIDFIDMSDQKHIQAVEKRLKEATSRDRARIQLGHISQFGLLEMSRQRLRPSLIETNSASCEHCRGTGLVRSTESMSLLVLRAIENEGIEGLSEEVLVTVPKGVDLYLLNQKRLSLTTIESRYQMHVVIISDEKLITPEYKIESLKDRKTPLVIGQALPLESSESEEDERDDIQDAQIDGEGRGKQTSPQGQSGEGSGRRRRRRRPFSKRRDSEQTKDERRGESPVKSGAPIKEDQETSRPPSGTIEEQIVKEIMGESQLPEANSSQSGHRKKDPEQVEGARKEGSGENPRRRRRRGRRSGQQRSTQGTNATEGQEKPLPATGVSPETKIAAIPLQRNSSEEKGTFQPSKKDISIPKTALPDGPESPNKKTHQGRWWKRLLES